MFVNFDCNPKTVRTLDAYVDEVEARFLNEVKGSYVDEVEARFLNEARGLCVVAHSFGARVAVLLANRNPELFEKMVLTGAAGLKSRFSLKVWLKIKWFKLTGRGKGSTDYRALSNTGKATFRNIIRRSLHSEITKLDTPTLLIWGKRDKSTPLYMAKRWTKLQKAAILKVYKAAGHFCFIDDPARFISDAFEFFEASGTSNAVRY